MGEHEGSLEEEERTAGETSEEEEAGAAETEGEWTEATPGPTCWEVGAAEVPPSDQPGPIRLRIKWPPDR